jgi:uroporphyrin-3 C-methyltransferase
MKFEKRSDASSPPSDGGLETAETQEAAPAEAAPAAPVGGNRNKPVLLYLVILFAIALLLILFSFAAQQRSSAETLKELQQQVDALQQLQDVQEQYAAATAENTELQQQIEEMEAAAAEASQRQQALQLLLQLQTYYANLDADKARAVAEQLQSDDLYLLLPTEAETATETDTGESPRALYDRIAAAISDPNFGTTGENEAE